MRSEATQVNNILRSHCESLPERISKVLREDEPKDIYSAIVSSQFDADRLDYIQRDRMATGVEFGHIDLEWLLDCLTVGKIAIGRNDPVETPCLFLGPKGIHVAEEYLEARHRLYRMVYMHKTTRAAEKMLSLLLCGITDKLKDHVLANTEPVIRHFLYPDLDKFLAIDDAAIFCAFRIYAELSPKDLDPDLSDLARRLQNRVLYKCVDIGACDNLGGNLFNRFKKSLNKLSPEWLGRVLYDNIQIDPYKMYGFENTSSLNKVLVKTRAEQAEPEDVINVSEVVNALWRQRIQRAYVPDQHQAECLKQILKERAQ